jgi:hypothetical protein
MERAIEELEKLETAFMHFRDQAAVREKHFRGVDAEKEGEMRGYKRAYSIALAQVQHSIETLKH